MDDESDDGSDFTYDDSTGDGSVGNVTNNSTDSNGLSIGNVTSSLSNLISAGAPLVSAIKKPAAATPATVAPVTGVLTPSTSSTTILIVVVALIALVGGLVFFRRGKGK